MTNFDYYAQDRWGLARLLSAATDAALRAKGCSAKLDFPPDGDWEAWLESELEELPRPPAETPELLTPDEDNKRAVIEKLEEIRAAIARVNTTFAQAIADIIDEAIQSVELLNAGA